jgi:hypothetical protein
MKKARRRNQEGVHPEREQQGAGQQGGGQQERE